MRTLRLKYGTAKTTDGEKVVGDIVDFEDDQAKAQMVCGAWEDITESLKTKVEKVEKKEDSGKDNKVKK